MDRSRDVSFTVGLIGAGIHGSASPALHEAEGAALGLSYVYRLMDIARLGVGVEALPPLLAKAEALGFAGVNVTHPCKQAVIPHLDSLSPEAEAIGAVNTVVLTDGRRHGYNTDAPGFADGLRAALPEAPLDRVLQVGAGGGGSATAYAALALLGVGVLTIVDADLARAAGLVGRLEQRFGASRARVGGDLDAELAEARGLINATPVGMTGHPGLPVPGALLRPDLWVADIVYVPRTTALLAAARAKGAPTADGAGMVVSQAARAIELFTGRTPDVARMRRHFEALRPA